MTATPSKRQGMKAILSFFFLKQKQARPERLAIWISMRISVRLKIAEQEARKRKSPAPIWRL